MIGILIVFVMYDNIQNIVAKIMKYFESVILLLKNNNLF